MLRLIVMERLIGMVLFIIMLLNWGKKRRHIREDESRYHSFSRCKGVTWVFSIIFIHSHYSHVIRWISLTRFKTKRRTIHFDHEVSLLLTKQLISFVLHKGHNQYFTIYWILSRARCVSFKHGLLKEIVYAAQL